MNNIYRLIDITASTTNNTTIRESGFYYALTFDGLNYLLQIQLTTHGAEVSYNIMRQRTEMTEVLRQLSYIIQKEYNDEITATKMLREAASMKGGE